MSRLVNTCGNCLLWAMDSTTILSGTCTIIGTGRTKHRSTCLSHSNNERKPIKEVDMPYLSTKTLEVRSLGVLRHQKQLKTAKRS